MTQAKDKAMQTSDNVTKAREVVDRMTTHDKYQDLRNQVNNNEEWLDEIDDKVKRLSAANDSSGDEFKFTAIWIAISLGIICLLFGQFLWEWSGYFLVGALAGASLMALGGMILEVWGFVIKKRKAAAKEKTKC